MAPEAPAGALGPGQYLTCMGQFFIISHSRQSTSHVRPSRNAGVAQLVERNLAKVEVASSSLVSRSSFGFKLC